MGFIGFFHYILYIGSVPDGGLRLAPFMNTFQEIVQAMHMPSDPAYRHFRGRENSARLRIALNSFNAVKPFHRPDSIRLGIVIKVQVIGVHEVELNAPLSPRISNLSSSLVPVAILEI